MAKHETFELYFPLLHQNIQRQELILQQQISFISNLPSDISFILSAILCAPVPKPGKFLGQVVTNFHSNLFFKIDVDFSGLLGVPLSPHEDNKPAAVINPADFNIFLLVIFFLTLVTPYLR